MNNEELIQELEELKNRSAILKELITINTQVADLERELEELVEVLAEERE